MYRFWRGRTFSEKLPKFPLFEPSLLNRLRLLGSQQHPQIGVLLTSFSTWGTEKSMAEINPESNIIWVENWQTVAASWAGALSCNKKNLPRSQILFQNSKNYGIGDVYRFCYHSLCDSTVIF
jgi:hypothetical protein